uniref:Uncharacterized protein n=1 Tax=Anguilla anguilla TaxID=7936 RepID=A0A0E9RMJ4_ANGAN
MRSQSKHTVYAEVLLIKKNSNHQRRKMTEPTPRHHDSTMQRGLIPYQTCYPKPQISFPYMSHHHYVQRSIHKMGPPILETFFFLQT